MVFCGGLVLQALIQYFNGKQNVSVIGQNPLESCEDHFKQLTMLESIIIRCIYLLVFLKESLA